MNYMQMLIALSRLGADLWVQFGNGNSDKVRTANSLLDLLEDAGVDINQFRAMRDQARAEGRSMSDAELTQLRNSMDAAVAHHNALTPGDVRR